MKPSSLKTKILKSEDAFVTSYCAFKVTHLLGDEGVLTYDHGRGQWDIRNSYGIIDSGDLDFIIEQITDWDYIESDEV